MMQKFFVLIHCNFLARNGMQIIHIPSPKQKSKPTTFFGRNRATTNYMVWICKQ